MHLIALNDWSRQQINQVLKLAADVKASPEKFHDAMHRKMLVMIFEKPSLRTRVSFETGICQMGGDAIFYDMSTSPMGAGKESIRDTVKTLSRYANIVMARLFQHRHMEEMAKHAGIPIINGMTDFNHPCQILADMMTIQEKKGALSGLKLAYLGDACNNVTHSLLYGCAQMGINISVGCPKGEISSPLPGVVKEAVEIGKKSGSFVTVTHDAMEAVKGADIVYTDSWMSYHIPKDQLDDRVNLFKPYQVNQDLMQNAASDAIFMNCLPAMRGYEQTAEVIDGPQSVVFDQAENRLYAQKAIMLKLMLIG